MSDFESYLFDELEYAEKELKTIQRQKEHYLALAKEPALPIHLVVSQQIYTDRVVSLKKAIETYTQHMGKKCK